MPTRKAQEAVRRCRGLAIVEFVIVLPICLILIIATAEFGRAFLQYNALTKTVRDGARHLAGKALFGSTGTVTISSGLETETQNLVVYGNIFGAGAPVLPGLTATNVVVADAGAGNVSVSASYPYGPIFGFVPGFFYGGGIDASAYTLQTSITVRAL
ncbi:MAG TPA: TadE family protein [Gammaproteobacteria bacterium]